MSILRAKVTEIWIDDALGQRVKIRPLTLSSRKRFIDLQTLISEVQTEYPDLTVSDLYDLDEDFKAAIDECLSLYGLSPESVSLAMLVQLFFVYDGGMGLCWQMDFSPSQKKGKLLDPDKDPHYHAIAAVWSFTPSLSLKEVMEIIDSLPWKDLEGILDARNEQQQEADPTYRREVTEEDYQEFAESLTSGGFGGPPIGGMLSKVLN